MKIVVVVPAFNEEKKIADVLNDLIKGQFLIYFVDDGSSDGTFAQASKIKRLDKKNQLKLLRHKVNLGKGAALKTGCISAFRDGAEAVIIMDGDGQHLVSDLPKFTKALNSKRFDVVFGSRNLNFRVPLVRFLGNKFASGFISLLFGVYVSDCLCGYRAFTKEAFQKLDWQSTGYGVETEMVVKSGKYKLRSCEILVETVYYDKFKGVTVLDAGEILADIFFWKFKL